MSTKYNVKCPDGSTVVGTLNADGVIQCPTFAVLLDKSKSAGYTCTPVDPPKSDAPKSATQSNATAPKEK